MQNSSLIDKVVLEKKSLNVFIIYGQGGHLEFRIITFSAKFCTTIILMLNMKFH